MIKDYEVKVLKLNAPLRGREAGDTVRVKTDKNGTPLDSYWRRRLKDAEIDGCVEFVKPAAKKTKELKIKEGKE